LKTLERNQKCTSKKNLNVVAAIRTVIMIVAITDAIQAEGVVGAQAVVISAM